MSDVARFRIVDTPVSFKDLKQSESIYKNPDKFLE